MLQVKLQTRNQSVFPTRRVKRYSILRKIAALHLEDFGGTSTVELQTKVDFAFLLVNLEAALFPLCGPLFQAVNTDANGTTRGELGHCAGHGWLSQ